MAYSKDIILQVQAKTNIARSEATIWTQNLS